MSDEFARVVDDSTEPGDPCFDVRVGDELIDAFKRIAPAEMICKILNDAASEYVRKNLRIFADKILEAYSDGEMHHPLGRFERYVHKLVDEYKPNV